MAEPHTGPAHADRPDFGFTVHHSDIGIVRTVIEVFTVGEYRYGKLEDAVAQARRAGPGS